MECKRWGVEAQYSGVDICDQEPVSSETSLSLLKKALIMVVILQTKETRESGTN